MNISGTKFVQCTKCAIWLKKVGETAEKWVMDTTIETTKARNNRNVPPEQWPQSLEILRYLVQQSKPVTIKEVSHGVNAPEISTRNRLARLESLGAVTASRAVSLLVPGKQMMCTHYVIAQYGRDCAGSRNTSPSGAVRPCVNSVFALAQAMNICA